MRNGASWDALNREIVACARCPRLRTHCLEVARVRRRAFRDQLYWGRPVPGFGDPAARALIVGLAPAAHGANRTGRMFTGDASGAWLYGALHRAGIASRGDSTSREDGLFLRGAFITAACRCAPPRNRPSPAELAACAPFLDREVVLLAEVRVVLALGRIAWDAVIRRARRADPAAVPRPAPAFGHGAAARVTLREGGSQVLLLGCYHPSRQNTQTGRLTVAMFESMILRTAEVAGLARAAP
ncbi:MAG: uracil-DNA glycosylase [Acidobacteriia bacterium]|nr:uracil-DNA glycosylase [Terriglobia bacterium]